MWGTSSPWRMRSWIGSGSSIARASRRHTQLALLSKRWASFSCERPNCASRSRSSQPCSMDVAVTEAHQPLEHQRLGFAQVPRGCQDHVRLELPQGARTLVAVVAVHLHALGRGRHHHNWCLLTVLGDGKPGAARARGGATPHSADSVGETQASRAFMPFDMGARYAGSPKPATWRAAASHSPPPGRAPRRSTGSSAPGPRPDARIESGPGPALGRRRAPRHRYLLNHHAPPCGGGDALLSYPSGKTDPCARPAASASHGAIHYVPLL